MADDFAPEDASPVPPAADLLGDPWCDLPDPRGRRKLRFRREVYGRVEELKAGGMSDADIARAVGVSERTARRVFSPELENGVARKRAELMTLVMDKARSGSVAAMKLAFHLLDKGAAQVPHAPDLPKERALGKKEDTVRRARDLDSRSEWGRLLN